MSSSFFQVNIAGCRIQSQSPGFEFSLTTIILNAGFLKKEIRLEFRATINSLVHVEPWKATRSLTISEGELTNVPARFLQLAASSMKTVNLTNNRLSIISAKDFIAMTQSGPIETLILDKNGIVDFGREFVDILMRFFMRGLTETLEKGLRWIKEPFIRTEVINVICRSLGLCQDARAVSLSSILRQNLFVKISFLNLRIELTFLFDKQKLRILSLNHNRLLRIPDAIFGFDKLQELHLAHNRIEANAFTKNQQYVFKLMKKLQVLNIASNNIDSLDENSFEFLSSLKRLDLERNRLTRLPPQIFRNQGRLEVLNLAFNSLSDLKFSSSILSLKVMNIRGNRITRIDNRMMQPMAHLERLDATYNPIEVISSGAFRGLNRLQILELSASRLKHLSSESMRMEPPRFMGDRVRLRLSELHQLRLRCDCNSVFQAAAHEADNEQFLVRFFYPLIEMPGNRSQWLCSNILGRHLSFSQALSTKGGGNLCRVSDLACPPKCGCCHHNMKTCACVFRCPLACSCYRSDSWHNVTVTCHGQKLQTLPCSFNSGGDSKKEKPMVTSMILSDSNLLLIGDFGADPCVKGLGRVQNLKIIKSNLREIKPNTFRCFPELKTLTITHNPFTSLPPVNLFTKQNQQLRSIDLSSNQLHRVINSSFSDLDNLAFLDLRQNPLECDCTWEEDFLTWAEAARRRGLDLLLPTTCRPVGELVRFGLPPNHKAALRLPFRTASVAAACRRIQLHRENSLRRTRLILSLSCPAAVLTMCAVTFLLIYRHYRFRLMTRINDALEWEMGRRLLRLSVTHNKPLDVCLIFHESQYEEQTKVRTYIREKAPHLTVESMMYFMPGALVPDQLRELYEKFAVCLIYISSDLLDDATYAGPIHEFLGECFHSSSASIRLVPIYPNNDSVLERKQLKPLRRMLRQYNGLQWNSPHFWDRLSLALPFRRQVNVETMDQLGYRNQMLADVCLVSHEDDLTLSRQIWEHYGGSVTMVHYRQGTLYNCSDQNQPSSLLEVFISCRQVRRDYTCNFCKTLTRKTKPESFFCVKILNSLNTIDVAMNDHWIEFLYVFIENTK